MAVNPGNFVDDAAHAALHGKGKPRVHTSRVKTHLEKLEHQKNPAASIDDILNGKVAGGDGLSATSPANNAQVYEAAHNPSADTKLTEPVKTGEKSAVEKVADIADNTQTAVNNYSDSLEGEGKDGTGKAKGAKPAEPSMVDKAMGGLEVANHYAGQAMLPVMGAGFLVGGLETITKKVGLQGASNQIGKLNGAMNKSLAETRASGLLEKLLQPGANAVAGVFAAADKVTGGMLTARGNRLAVKAATQQATLDGLTGKLTTYANTPGIHVDVKGALGALQNELGQGVQHLEPKQLEDLLKPAKQLAEGHGYKNVSSHLATLEKQAGKTFTMHARAARWQDAPAAIKNWPKQWIKETTRHGLVDKGLWGGTTLATAALTTHELAGSFTALREMTAVMTGVKTEDVGFMTLMSNKLPEPVKEARNQLLKSAGPRALTEAAGVAFSLNFLLRGAGMRLMMMLMPVQIGMSMLGGNTAVDTYKMMKKTENAHQENSAEAYTQLVGTLSADLNQRGGAESRFAQALGEKYAEEKLSADQVLKKISSGELDKDIANLQKEALAKTEQSTTQAASPHIANSQSASKFTQKVIPKDIKPKEMVTGFANQVQARQMAPAVQGIA